MRSFSWAKKSRSGSTWLEQAFSLVLECSTVDGYCVPRVANCVIYEKNVNAFDARRSGKLSTQKFT
jgi:hypothetical protein